MSFLWGSKKEEPKPEPQTGFDLDAATNMSSVLNSAAVQLHPLAELDKGVEYLDIEGETILSDAGAQNGFLPLRGFNDDLCYGTGTVYLAALSTGGAYGFIEGVRNIPAGTTSNKLRLNTILNHITKRGPFLGNHAAVLAVTYNIFNSLLGVIKGKHDDYNSLAAGALTGAIFKSSKGIKPMAISTALMTAAAGAWCGIKRLAK